MSDLLCRLQCSKRSWWNVFHLISWKETTEMQGDIGETVAEPTVRNLQLFDLNGRRVLTARKGIFIVKKQMSDGTIRTEKVIVK